MSHRINLAIQVLPLGIPKPEAYNIIDKAIQCIQASGLKHKVCPFETVIEGGYKEVMQLVDDVQNICHGAGANELLVNMKIHRSFITDMSIDDKTGKYKD